MYCLSSFFISRSEDISAGDPVHESNGLRRHMLSAVLSGIKQPEVNTNEINTVIFLSGDQDFFLEDINLFSSLLSLHNLSHVYPVGICAEEEMLFSTGAGSFRLMATMEGQSGALLIIMSESYTAGFLLSVNPLTQKFAQIQPDGKGSSLITFKESQDVFLIERKVRKEALADLLCKINLKVNAEHRASEECLKSSRQENLRLPQCIFLPPACHISISNTGFGKGEPAPISGIDENVLSEDSALTLSMMGLNNYLKTERAHSDLINRALAETLEKFEGPLSEITHVVISSHTFKDYGAEYLGIKEALSGMGINAEMLLVYMARCAGAVSAVRYSSLLIREDSTRKVLVVLVDKVADEIKGRTLNNGMAIFSDSSCSFIMSSGKEGFQVLGYSECFNNDMAEVNPNQDLVKYLQDFSIGFRNASQPFFSLENGICNQKDTFLIIGNYNLSIMRNYSRILGFDPKQLYTKQLAETAHMYSSDIIYNAEKLKSENSIKAGDLLLLAGTGSYQWGSILLAYTA